MALPMGWPRDLIGPEADGFDEAVVNWLLDRCPPEYRSYEVLRRQPRALSRLAVHHCEATLTGARAAYASARRELSDAVPPQALPDVLAAIEAEGARLAATLREVNLVDEALAGMRWRPRL
jgi:hypothetical protein